MPKHEARWATYPFRSEEEHAHRIGEPIERPDGNIVRIIDGIGCIVAEYGNLQGCVSWVYLDRELLLLGKNNRNAGIIKVSQTLLNMPDQHQFLRKPLYDELNPQQP